MAKRKPREHTEEYPNQGSIWTAKEEELIMNSELLDKDLSKVLGRTESSIHNHRHLMYKNRKDIES